MRLLLLVVALAFVPAAASAELRPPQVTRAVEIASGVTEPDVSCETSDVAWSTEVVSVGATPGHRIGGYTLASRVRLAPWVCQNLTPAAPRFGEALYVMGVEAARLAGHRGPGSQAMAGCWGLLWSADLGRRVWGISFFTPASERLTEQALALHRASLPSYRTICR